MAVSRKPKPARKPASKVRAKPKAAGRKARPAKARPTAATRKSAAPAKKLPPPTLKPPAGVRIEAPTLAAAPRDPHPPRARVPRPAASPLRQAPAGTAGAARRPAGQARRGLAAGLPRRDRERARRRLAGGAAAQADLLDRRVEITGPVDRKMIINALNSGAQRASWPTSRTRLTPTWANMIEGQRNLRDAIRRTIGFTDPATRQAVPAGRQAGGAARASARLAPRREARAGRRRADVRARCSISASTSSTTRSELLERGSGPYFYLPKMESHLEARLWNDVFLRAQAALGVPRAARSRPRC